MSGSNIKILVIDDEELVLESVVMAMERQRHTVASAPNLKEAFSKLEGDEFDLVISDIRLPEGRFGGMEILKKVKAERPDTEVIMMTGFGTIENAVEAIRGGAFDYVEKGSGLLIPTLEHRVEKALERRRQKEKLSSLEEKNRTAHSAPNWTPAMASRTSSAVPGKSWNCSTS